MYLFWQGARSSWPYPCDRRHPISWMTFPHLRDQCAQQKRNLTTKCRRKLQRFQLKLKNHSIICKFLYKTFVFSICWILNEAIYIVEIIRYLIFRYLKEFRTQQCTLFLQHKCTQHRPFTCFHWHFMNQRRRRPIRKRDGTFNYSPDVYCTKYDETNGVCADGDE